jgi:hypothetical protein
LGTTLDSSSPAQNKEKKEFPPNKMATFSLGTSGVTPGAPGVYINERAGNVAFGEVSAFSTVYMLVETEQSVSTTTFPFNTPIPVTSLLDYRALLGGIIPTSRIPALSYNCVNEFFQNAQVGDLRVVRVGTPDQIVEIEFFPSGSKINSTELPSALMAGNVVYVQMVINGLRIVSGDGSTGYTENGEWLGVPVTIPVNYVAGDEANNRKISLAIATAVAAAIESNPSAQSSVYVRSFGLISEVDSTQPNSQNSFIAIAGATFNAPVSIITEVLPVGGQYVFMQNTYDLNNIVGGSVDLVRVPADYEQCIDTAFDGQQDQGYLVTPTAYAQFDSAGRAAVGAKAAAHCQNNNYKWMALADPGPFNITGVNKYSNYTPHQAAASLYTGLKYLVDNAIYEWTGTDVTYDRLNYQSLVFGSNSQISVQESTNSVPTSTQIGLLDSGIYNGASNATYANRGIFQLDSSNYWPVTLPIQKAILGGASASTNDLNAYNGTEVYVIAPPYTPLQTSDYSLNYVYLAATATAAAAILNQITLAGGTDAARTAALTPTGCISVGAPTGTTFTLTYVDSAWNLPVTINGQTSNLIQNITANTVGVNTSHLPGTLQDPTETYRLGFVSRTILDPSVSAGGVSPYGQVGPVSTVGSLVSGNGYVPGSYTGVTAVGGSGTALQLDILVDVTGVVTNATVTVGNAGTGYFVGDTITVPAASLGGTGSGFSVKVATVVGQTNNAKTGAVNFNIINHGLQTGQRVFFTQNITVNGLALVKGTTKLVSNPYWVTVVDLNNFVLSSSIADYSAQSFVKFANGFISNTPTVLYSNTLGGGITDATLGDLTAVPVVRGRKYAFNSSFIFNQAANSTSAPAPVVGDPGVAVYFNNSSVILGTEQISPFGEDYTTASWLPSLNLPAPTATPVSAVNNAYCVPTVKQNFQSEAHLVPTITAIAGGTYDPTATGLVGPIATLGAVAGGSGYNNGTYTGVYLTGGTGTGAIATIVIAGGIVTSVTITSSGYGYSVADSLTAPVSVIGGGTLFTVPVATVTATTTGALVTDAPYTVAASVIATSSANSLQAARAALVGVYFTVVVGTGYAPDGTTAVVVGDRFAATYDGSTYSWVVVPAATLGGDLTTVGQPCYGAQVQFVFTPEQTPPHTLWRFDAITSTEIIDNALRGVGFNGTPQAVFIDAGVDNVNRLSDDSQKYSNPFGFIAYYGPYIENGSAQWIPPSPYVTGVAVRRYRAEGYQFPPAGVKYQLIDAVATQIAINSAQQNLLNPEGCNAIRTLPGYPQTAVFIWGGRTRVNTKDAQQKLYQFVNTRVILNVVYGSLRNAFDSQIFNVIDGFGVIYNQIISIGNSVLNQLYVKGALYGARPSDAFQVICDARVNPPADLENGIVNAKVFVTPVPTLERIQIDLIRVAIGQMQKELDSQGLGTNNGRLG